MSELQAKQVNLKEQLTKGTMTMKVLYYEQKRDGTWKKVTKEVVIHPKIIKVE